MLFQNDVPTDLACHSSNLNMKVSSGEPKIIPKQSCTTETMPFNDVLLVVMGPWHSPYESPSRIRLQAKPGLVGKHHTHKPTVYDLHNSCSLLQTNHRHDERGESYGTGVQRRPHQSQYEVKVRQFLQPCRSRHAAHAHRGMQTAADLLRSQGM
ncbi:uncharacterized protein TNCV_2728261 [Trichonephila clavipes]|nr:uncharacterized protein TNCV_2728261 [Trichonephila clavipes]